MKQRALKQKGRSSERRKCENGKKGGKKKVSSTRSKIKLMSENENDVMTKNRWAEPAYPDDVHLLAVLHEVPDFGSYLLPHPAELPEHAELLEGPVHLNAPQTRAQVSLVTLGYLINTANQLQPRAMRRDVTSYLMDDPLCGGGVGGVQDLPQQEGLQGLPDHPGHGVGVHALHKAVTVRSCNTHSSYLSVPELWRSST